MSPSSPGALAISRRVLSTLVILNVLYGLAILALLVASLIAAEPLFRALGVKAALTGALIGGMRMIMVVGILSAPISHVILTRLLAMVDTVRGGDPFVVGNADRLQLIAWCVLVLELLHLAVGAIAAGVASSGQPLDIGWSFSLTPWIAVLLLFVLARVFDHGARMRADLEGTI